MRYSQVFGKTVKTAPSDLKAVSHKLLYKAGFIRQMSSGRYSFLPLGYRVWHKIYKIIQKEMDKIGVQQVVTPTLHPVSFWQATNRDKAFGDLMLAVEDHHGSIFVIGGTAEGMMVELVKKFKPSYRDLPIVIYQFSNKFRDEKRSRGGLLRTREFMMKDAYSFTATEKESLEIYEKFYQSYLRIAERLDLKVVSVQAQSGAIGGDYNHEFMVPAEVGEDTIFTCNKCDYAANVEKAEFVREKVNTDEKMKKLKTIEQPEWVETMEDNVKHYDLAKNRFLKNVVFKTPAGKIVVAVIRGDLEVSAAKIERLLKIDGQLEPASDGDLKKIGAQRGYVHSWGHEKAVFVGDLSLKTVRNFIGGQKEKQTDAVNVNYGRDFETDYFGDIAEAGEGNVCLQCKKGKLESRRAVEFGHIFKQDHFYTGPMEGNFVNEDGQRKPMWMGAYGIGVGRAMAIIAETHYDEKGLIWPKSVAPYEVYLINLKSDQLFVDQIYEELQNWGIEVLYDDREEVSAGEKFADADLIGAPVRLVVSDKTKDKIEYKKRDSDKMKLLSLKELKTLF